MAHFRVTKSIKKNFTGEEEVERILSNLKRLYKISLYPQNSVRESIVPENFNCKLCGIDKSGREKIFTDTSYSDAQYPPVSRLGIEECRRRNYCVVKKAIGELIPGGKVKFKILMPIDEFYLYTFNGNAYWLSNKPDGILFSEEINDKDDWEQANNITHNQIWTSYNSVDICQKILNIIKKKVILNKLSVNSNRQEGSFLGGATW